MGSPLLVTVWPDCFLQSEVYIKTDRFGTTCQTGFSRSKASICCVQNMKSRCSHVLEWAKTLATIEEPKNKLSTTSAPVKNNGANMFDRGSKANLRNTTEKSLTKKGPLPLRLSSSHISPELEGSNGAEPPRTYFANLFVCLSEDQACFRGHFQRAREVFCSATPPARKDVLFFSHRKTHTLVRQERRRLVKQRFSTHLTN